MGERYKMVPKESKGVVKGEYGKTPAPISAELIKKILGDEEPITCRPADLIAEPELHTIRAKIEEYIIQDEDVLTYALLPQVAEKFFKMRKDGTLNQVKRRLLQKQLLQRPEVAEEDDDELVAVLSAAIAAEEAGSGVQYAINSIKQVSPWVLAGRLNR
jgi:oxaloacetate decarboxylase (Na+ extruding) subunit alpha